MAAHLSETEIENIKRLFLAVDEDGSGEISVAELRSILGDKKLKMSEEDIDRFLQEFDRDGSGTIDICEFLIMMSNKKNKARLRIYVGTNTAALRSIAMHPAYIFLIIL